MLKRIINKRAEGYVETCISVMMILCILVVIINLFSFVTLKANLDQIADELLATATYSGCFYNEFDNRDLQLLSDYDYYDVDYGADRYFNSTYKRVQLGERMWVKVSVNTYVQGLGVFKIPITVSVKRSGVSERYWKAGE